MSEEIYLISSELIAPLILWMPSVSLEPVPVDGVCLYESIKGYPQLLIFNRLSVGGFPAVLLPVEDPLSDSLSQILRVGVEIDNAWFFKGAERLDRRLKLHLIVGRGRVPP